MTALFGDGSVAPAPKTQPNQVEGRVPPPACRGMEGGAPPPAHAPCLIDRGVVPVPGVILAAGGAKEGAGEEKCWNAWGWRHVILPPFSTVSFSLLFVLDI